MKEIYDTISVPFFSEELVDRGDGTSTRDIEALLAAEFGEADEFIISPNKVKVGDKTLIDLDADAVFAEADQYTEKRRSDPEALKDFNRPTIPATEGTMVFTSRIIQNRGTLRIAVHSDLVQLYRPALNALLSDVRKKRQKNIEIDLTHCQQLSLTGIGVLLLIKENAATGCKIALKNCSLEISKKLKWVNLDSVFTITRKKL